MNTKKNKKRKLEEPRNGDNLAVEWGETNQERILERSPKSRSARHTCKGRHCGPAAFEKL